jgi:hypothetical protein
MKNTKNNQKSNQYPISSLREELRLRSLDVAGRLSRSVGRLTSCESLPCLEYGEEVLAEQSLAKELFFLQHCRNALEHCIGSGGATLRYRWGDGRVTNTRFHKIGPGRVKVTGHQPL